MKKGWTPSDIAEHNKERAAGRPPSPRNAQAALAILEANRASGSPMCQVCGGCGKKLPDLYYDCDACEGSGLYFEGRLSR